METTNITDQDANSTDLPVTCMHLDNLLVGHIIFRQTSSRPLEIPLVSAILSPCKQTFLSTALFPLGQEAVRRCFRVDSS